MTGTTRIDVARAVTPTGVVEPASLLLEDGRLAAVGSPADVGETAGAQLVVQRHATAVPGFIDLQVNGGAGVDFRQGVDADWDAVSHHFLSRGVTALCPTLPSMPRPDYHAALGSLARWAARSGTPRIIGAHLEGPFLNPLRRGVHAREHLSPPDIDWAGETLDASPVPVTIWTLAPELPGAFDLIRAVRERNVVVSAGHSEASYDVMVAACDAGLSMVTHLFNAQAPLHHREPGIVGAALSLDALFAGLILDGVHVHEGVAAAVLRALGSRGFAVTDATAGPTRLSDGTLAGSDITMLDAFSRAERLLGLERAVELTATTPARAIGRDDLGVLRAGAAADVVLLDDERSVVEVWLAGQRVP